MAQSTVGQTNDRPVLSLHSGLQTIHSRDRVISNFIYSDTRMPVSLALTRYRKHTYSELIINYSNGYAKHQLGTGTHRSIEQSALQYNKEWHITNLRPNLQLYGGLMADLTTLVERSSYVIGRSYKTGENSTGTFVLSSGAAFQLNYTASGKHQATISLDLPVINFALRPGYSMYYPFNTDNFGDTFKNGETKVVGQFADIRAALKYVYHVHDRHWLLVRYQFSFFRYPDPMEYKFMTSGLLVGYGLRL